MIYIFSKLATRRISLPHVSFVMVGIMFFSACFSACGVIKPKKRPEMSFEEVTENPLSPDEAKEVLSESAGDWFYGEGLGDSALKVGTAVAFPPYALVLLGNGILSLSGYEPVGVSSFLPDESAENWSEFYGTVTSGPGRFTAAVAGKEFRTKEVVQEKMRQFLANRPDAKEGSSADEVKIADYVGSTG